MNGYSPTDVATLLGRHILHFRAVDAVRGVSRHLGETTLLGRGSCEIPLLLAILEQHEYRGYITLQRQGRDDLSVELTNAMEYLKHL